MSLLKNRLKAIFNKIIEEKTPQKTEKEKIIEEYLTSEDFEKQIKAELKQFTDKYYQDYNQSPTLDREEVNTNLPETKNEQTLEELLKKEKAEHKEELEKVLN